MPIPDIVKWNGIKDVKKLYVGQKLIVAKGRPDEPTEAELAAKVTDKKAFMYGAVKDKNVRHNFLFGTCDQAPDYASKKAQSTILSKISHSTGCAAAFRCGRELRTPTIFCPSEKSITTMT